MDSVRHVDHLHHDERHVEEHGVSRKAGTAVRRTPARPFPDLVEDVPARRGLARRLAEPTSSSTARIESAAATPNAGPGPSPPTRPPARAGPAVNAALRAELQAPVRHAERLARDQRGTSDGAATLYATVPAAPTKPNSASAAASAGLAQTSPRMPRSAEHAAPQPQPSVGAARAIGQEPARYEPAAGTAASVPSGAGQSHRPRPRAPARPRGRGGQADLLGGLRREVDQASRLKRNELGQDETGCSSLPRCH